MVQRKFLFECIKTCAVVNVFLINGIKLIGIINRFDDSIIILKNFNNDGVQLIYKDTISTIENNFESI